MSKIDRKEMSKGLFVAHLSSILRFQFQEFREYFESMQLLFKSEDKRISDWIETKTAKLSPEEQEQFGELYSEDYWKYKSSFPAIQRTAIFITIYSELEDVLKFLCRALAAEIKCNIQTYKWRGGILEKFKVCLEKDIGLETSNIVVLWNEVIKIRKIRNAIVHSGGWLYKGETSEAEVIDYIFNRRKSVTLNDKGDGFYRIELSDAFIFDVMDIFDQLLMELLSSISDWVKRKTA